MEAAVKHRCYYREESQGVASLVRDWYLLPAHLLATLAVSVGLLFGINGRIFAIDGQNTYPPRLSQSDVVTLVSIALIVVRFLAASWVALAGWRMAFIVMEKGGATLTEIDRLVTHRLPMFRLPPSRPGQPHSPRYSQPVLFILWLIFFLSTPSQFVAPIATGAINWSPYTSGNPAEAEFNVKITTAGTTNIPGNQYNDYEFYAHNRDFVRQMAIGIASLATKPNFLETGDNPLTFRRRIPSEIDRDLGSRLGNASVPSFVIHSLDWIQNETDLSQEELSTVHHIQTDAVFPGANMSSDSNPVQGNGSIVGALSIILPGPWQPENIANLTADGHSFYYLWPKPEVISGSYLVMVLTHRNDSTFFTPWKYCGQVESPLFGDTNTTVHYLNFNPDTDLPHCYAIARVNFTAGVLECRDCSMDTPGVVQYSGQREDLHPQPSALTNTALAMMPEVLVGNSIANSSLAPTWQNLDGYTRGMLSVAYQAAWNSLSDEFLAPDDQMQTTTVIPPLFALNATVVSWRVHLWAMLNALVAISGCLLAFLQHGCQHKTIRRPAISALLLDAGPVLRTDAAGLCNATSLKRSHEPVGLRLHVRPPGPGYIHPVLVSDRPDEHPATSVPNPPYAYGQDRKIDRKPVSGPFSPQASVHVAEKPMFPHGPSASPRPGHRYGSSGEVTIMHRPGNSMDSCIHQPLNAGTRWTASEALAPSTMPRS